MKFNKILFIGLVLYAFSSCSKSEVQFIPHAPKSIQDQINFLIPSNSTSDVIKNNIQTTLNTQLNSELIIEANSFLSPSENTDITFNFNTIELNSFADYIKHRITTSNNLGLITNHYAVFVEAVSENDKLSLNDGKTIKLRIPSAELPGNPKVGSGVPFDDGTMEWRFSPNETENLEYTSWTDNNSNDVEGYEVEVKKTGWISLSSVPDIRVNYNSICVELEGPHDGTNTQLYILSEANNYIQSSDFSDSGNSLCIDNIPDIGSTLKLISVSYLEDRGELYFSEQNLMVSNANLNVKVSPQKIDKQELQRVLVSL